VGVDDVASLYCGGRFGDSTGGTTACSFDRIRDWAIMHRLSDSASIGMLSRLSELWNAFTQVISTISRRWR
jgi:hypothetical protein